MRIEGLSSRAIIGRFYETLESMLDAGWAQRIAMPFTSDQASETYNWLGMAPALREWVSGRLVRSLRENGLTITNKTFEASIGIHIDDLRRDKTGQIMVRVDELAERAAQHWEKLLSTFITNGNGSTSGLAYDGQYFFDVDHSEGDSGTQLNLLAKAQVGRLDVVKKTEPTEAEMALAILGVIGYMQGYKDDRGEPINGGARQWLVMLPTPLWPAAVAACTKNNLQAAAGNVTDNILKAGVAFNVEPVCNPRLTWTEDFAVFRTDGRVKPFIQQEELPAQMDVIGEGSEMAINERMHQYSVTAIRNIGYGLWQHAARATLSTIT